MSPRRVLQALTLVALILLGALAGSQVPRFIQEYEQRLGGAWQEASRLLADYHRVATENHLDFAEYLQRLAASPDSSIVATGRTIAATQTRVATLGAEAAALERAPRLLKPFVLLRYYDPALLSATWRRFEVTLTLDPAFAVLGALFGWLLNALAWSLPRHLLLPAGRRAGP